MRALRNAHAAGDTAAAKRLAQMAKAAQAAPPAVAPEDVRDERGVPGGVHTPETQTQTPASTEFGGLVGNESTARLENTMANVPIVGGKIRNKQSRQTRQFGERVQAIAEDVRGYPSHLPPDPHTIGTKIQNNIAEGMQTISSRIDALEGNLGARAATAKTAVSVGGIKDELASLSAKSTPDQQAILSKAANDLDAMRDVPLDAKLHETLMGQRKILKQNLRKARTAAMEKPDDVQVLKQEKLMRKNLDDLDAKIDANLGVDYTRMRAWRSEIGAKTQQGGIKGGAMKKTYGATTEAIQGFTDRAGMRADFDDLMAAENELYRRKGNLSEGGDIPFGRKLTEMPTGKDVYDATMRAGVQAPEKLDVVRRNMAPEQWDEETENRCGFGVKDVFSVFVFNHLVVVRIFAMLPAHQPRQRIGGKGVRTMHILCRR
uniref:Uncharacterized protein n=1 Tax=Steinernema hermaphroditum TaxID=289476 RepID=A0AA39GN14_9BILA|nr:hypothetical protein QR680_019394 [Steinernema hermaphroditum]